jgi:hypothetical protein
MGEETPAPSEHALVEAKLALDNAVAEFTQSQSFGRDHRAVASERLHTAVINLFWKLRSQLQLESDAWEDLDRFTEMDGERIWDGTHPVEGEIEIEGLSDLDEWIQKEVRVERELGGPNRTNAEEYETRVLRLPAGAALEVARVLSLEFYNFDLDVEVSKEQQTPIDDDLMEEVEEWRQANV